MPMIIGVNGKVNRNQNERKTVFEWNVSLSKDTKRNLDIHDDII
jgi:hypothetical protein